MQLSNNQDEERRLLIALKNSSVRVNLQIAQYVNSPQVELKLGIPVYQLLKRDTIPPFSLSALSSSSLTLDHELSTEPLEFSRL